MPGRGSPDFTMEELEREVHAAFAAALGMGGIAEGREKDEKTVRELAIEFGAPVTTAAGQAMRAVRAGRMTRRLAWVKGADGRRMAAYVYRVVSTQEVE